MRFEGEVPGEEVVNPSAPSKVWISRHIRAHVQSQLYDESSAPAEGTAIYTLSDPREIRAARYVGQTTAPRRRLLQHLNTARLWMPDEIPWWVRSPDLRPLYVWIRDLYSDGERLPTMVVHEWCATQARARVAERALICECLRQQLPLFNSEAGMLAGRPPLI